MNSTVASFFFASNPSAIRLIAIIWEVVGRFVFKADMIFPNNFIDFVLYAIKKKGIMKLSSNSSKYYVSIVLNDSEVTFLGEEKDAIILFIYRCVFIDCFALSKYIVKSYYLNFKEYYVRSCRFSVFNVLYFLLQHQGLHLQAVLLWYLTKLKYFWQGFNVWRKSLTTTSQECCE